MNIINELLDLVSYIDKKQKKSLKLREEFKKYLIDCRLKNKQKINDLDFLNENENEKGVDNIKKNNKGSLTFRSDGRWMGRVYINGKQKCVYDHSKENCKLKLLELIKKFNQTNDINSTQLVSSQEKKEEKKEIVKPNLTPITFGESFFKWFDNSKKPTLKESSIKVLERYLKQFNKNDIFNIPISKIKHENISDFINNIKSQSTKKNIKILFKAFFLNLYEIGVLDKNIYSFCVFKKEENEFIREENVKTQNHKILENGIENKLVFKNRLTELFFNYLLNTGVRFGEGLALCLEDINFEKNYIFINKQYNLLTQKITTPKTKKSNRKIPLFDKTKEIIKELIQLNSDNEKYFFKDLWSYKQNLFIKISNDNKELLNGLKIHAHMLRKTFISRCLFDYKIDIKVVQEWVGHQNILTTDSFYSFANTNTLNTSIENYNKFS